MNLNILAYIIYFITTASIIYFVGRICYRNGNIFIQHLLNNNTNLAMQVNKLLLIAYYLMNMGYCALTILSWTSIDSYLFLLELIALKIGIILMIIGIMHYINIFLLRKFINKLI